MGRQLSTLSVQPIACTSCTLLLSIGRLVINLIRTCIQSPKGYQNRSLKEPTLSNGLMGLPNWLEHTRFLIWPNF